MPWCENCASHLKKTVYYLSPHIFLVRIEQVALDQPVDAFRDAVVRVEIFGYPGSTIDNDMESGRTFVAGGDVEV